MPIFTIFNPISSTLVVSFTLCVMTTLATLSPFSVLAALTILFVLFAGMACQVQSSQGSFTDIRPGNLGELLDSKEVVIIDVRTPQEWDRGLVPEALRINLQDRAFADRIASLDPDANYLIYCNSGNRSRVASRYMINNGFRHVYNYDGSHFQIRREYEQYQQVKKD